MKTPKEDLKYGCLYGLKKKNGISIGMYQWEDYRWNLKTWESLGLPR